MSAAEWGFEDRATGYPTPASYAHADAWLLRVQHEVEDREYRRHVWQAIGIAVATFVVTVGWGILALIGLLKVMGVTG